MSSRGRKIVAILVAITVISVLGVYFSGVEIGLFDDGPLPERARISNAGPSAGIRVVNQRRRKTSSDQERPEADSDKSGAAEKRTNHGTSTSGAAARDSERATGGSVTRIPATPLEDGQVNRESRDSSDDSIRGYMGEDASQASNDPVTNLANLLWREASQVEITKALEAANSESYAKPAWRLLHRLAMSVYEGEEVKPEDVGLELDLVNHLAFIAGNMSAPHILSDVLDPVIERWKTVSDPKSPNRRRVDAIVAINRDLSLTAATDVRDVVAMRVVWEHLKRGRRLSPEVSNIIRNTVASLAMGGEENRLAVEPWLGLLIEFVARDVYASVEAKSLRYHLRFGARNGSNLSVLREFTTLLSGVARPEGSSPKTQSLSYQLAQLVRDLEASRQVLSPNSNRAFPATELLVGPYSYGPNPQNYVNLFEWQVRTLGFDRARVVLSAETHPSRVSMADLVTASEEASLHLFDRQSGVRHPRSVTLGFLATLAPRFEATVFSGGTSGASQPFSWTAPGEHTSPFSLDNATDARNFGNLVRVSGRDDQVPVDTVDVACLGLLADGPLINRLTPIMAIVPRSGSAARPLAGTVNSLVDHLTVPNRALLLARAAPHASLSRKQFAQSELFPWIRNRYAERWAESLKVGAGFVRESERQAGYNWLRAMGQLSLRSLDGIDQSEWTSSPLTLCMDAQLECVISVRAREADASAQDPNPQERPRGSNKPTDPAKLVRDFNASMAKLNIARETLVYAGWDIDQLPSILESYAKQRDASKSGTKSVAK